ETLKKTPLYDRHVALGGKMVNFSGWAMPVYYSGIIAEHQWTRESCSVFDVSHLGEFRVKGPKAFQFLQYRLTNDLQKLENGKIIYSILCDEKGLALDDILIYQNNPEDFYLIVNAGSIERDWDALKKYAPDDLDMQNQSDQMACVAIQGPKSEGILEKLFGFKLQDLGYYRFKEEKLEGRPVWVSRSGYTGEDGFEIFSSNDLATPIWDRLIKEGKALGVLPAGLGARNTLRLEAGNILYGNDLDMTTTPVEAGLLFAIAFNKPGGFVGRDILSLQKAEGTRRKLVGFKMLEKSIARDHYPILKNGRKVGSVTSGSFAPTVGANIGMGYVDKGQETVGNTLEIEIHGRLAKAEVVKLPFIPLRHKRKVSL
ncbi:MAG TPA: glycine cleavage system aminomethyltransferase GcvT, partial [Candidatus Omnitrophota bacterium]|nr:glycine cleavage system aminomethyltransferase GcvT [Candidatus Omnitrophota bacterium]